MGKACGFPELESRRCSSNGKRSDAIFKLGLVGGVPCGLFSWGRFSEIGSTEPAGL